MKLQTHQFQSTDVLRYIENPYNLEPDELRELKGLPPDVVRKFELYVELHTQLRYYVDVAEIKHANVGTIERLGASAPVIECELWNRTNVIIGPFDDYDKAALGAEMINHFSTVYATNRKRPDNWELTHFGPLRQFLYGQTKIDDENGLQALEQKRLEREAEKQALIDMDLDDDMNDDEATDEFDEDEYIASIDADAFA